MLFIVFMPSRALGCFHSLVSEPPPTHEATVTIDPQLLEILVCPESKQPVAFAGADVLERLNAAIADGTAVTLGGETIGDSVTHGLLREDGRILYPVRDGIPIMLIDESIDLSRL